MVRTSSDLQMEDRRGGVVVVVKLCLGSASIVIGTVQTGSMHDGEFLAW